MFALGGKVFVHADVVVVMTPYEGPSAGLPFTFLACNKLETKHNGKSVTIKGNSIVPVSLALAEAEPSWSLGLGTALVAIDYAEHCGGKGHGRMAHDIVLTATRPGIQSVTFNIVQAIIENGFGFMSDAGGEAKDEFSGKNRQTIMVYKGQEYDPFTLPETGLTL